MKTKEIGLDIVYIHSIFDGNIKEIQSFLKDYEEITTDKIKQLDIAIQNKDPIKVKEIFHFIKGSSSFIKKIHNLCIQGEEELKQIKWENIELTYHNLVNCFELIKQEINNYPEDDS